MIVDADSVAESFDFIIDRLSDMVERYPNYYREWRIGEYKRIVAEIQRRKMSVLADIAAGRLEVDL